MAEIRNSAVIYQSNLIQIRKLQASGKSELAGKLAIATIEVALTGETTTDDLMIELMLEQYKAQADKNADKFDRTVESKRQGIIDKQGLREIADLMNEGYKQIEISKKLGVSPSTISDRVKKIRRDFPELLSGGIKKSGGENPDSDGFEQEADNSEISKNSEGTGFELSSKNPGDSKNSENSAVSEKQPNNLSGPDTDSDEKSGNEADFIEKTGFIF